MIVPDFFIGALIDCLIDKGAERRNVIKCLELLETKISTLSTKQHNEIYSRLNRIMLFDDNSELIAMQGNFTETEKDLWLAIYNKTADLLTKKHIQFA